MKPPNQSDIRQYLSKVGGGANDRLVEIDFGSSLTVGYLPCLVENPNTDPGRKNGGEERVEDYNGSSLDNWRPCQQLNDPRLVPKDTVPILPGSGQTMADHT